MRTARTKAMLHAVLVTLVACAAQLMLVGQSWAQVNSTQEYAPVWYEGMQVSGLLLPNEPARPHIPKDRPTNTLQPFYFIITPGAGRVQDAVIGSVPGDIGYTGWWQWSALLDFSGRDLANDPYTSAGEVEDAICTIPGFPGNIGTCVVNGTPLIDVTGLGGETNFVFHIPIVASPPQPAVCQ